MQSDIISGKYPRGFEFKGSFKNGMREGLGIMKIPFGRMNYKIYKGYFSNNMMDGLFTVIN
jgi:hypothetical protein